MCLRRIRNFALFLMRSGQMLTVAYRRHGKLQQCLFLEGFALPRVQRSGSAGMMSRISFSDLVSLGVRAVLWHPSCVHERSPRGPWSRCLPPGLRSESVHPYFTVLPMGFSWAFYLAQECLRAVVARALPTVRFLQDHTPAPDLSDPRPVASICG